MQKNINKDYNSGEFLEKLLEKEKIKLVGNTASVDGYTFLIDREKLIIVEEIEEELSNVQIAKVVTSYLGKKENDKYYVKAEVTIESEEEIESITLTSDDKTNIEITPSGKTATQEVEIELGRKYKVITITKGGVANTNTLIEEKEETISDINELMKLKNNVNKGLTYEGKIITQTQDIDLSSVCNSTIGSWEPIGYNTTWFKGIYNGNGKDITSLYINNTEDKMTGLFGFLGYNGTIKNLTVSGNIESTSDRLAGGIAGRNEGIIDNCINNVNVKNNINGAGGITGGNYNVIKNCINNGKITGVDCGTGGIMGSDNLFEIRSATNVDDIAPIIENCVNSNIATIEGSCYVGGICGRQSKSKINKCTNEGTVIASISIIGGIAGQSQENITSCKNTGTVTSNGSPNDQTNTQGTGGIVGRTSKKVSKCSNIGKITSKGFFTGGIVGFGEEGTKIQKSYNYNASIHAGKSAAGGVLGRGDGITIEDCYNYFSKDEYYIKAQEENAGGIIGIFAGDTNSTIKNCYSIGNNISSVSTTFNVPNYYAGAVIGVTYGDTTIISNVYYEDTNPLQALSPDSYATTGTIQQKLQQELKSGEANENSVVYTFNKNLENEIWEQNNEVNGGYPYLKENKP